MSHLEEGKMQIVSWLEISAIIKRGWSSRDHQTQIITAAGPCAVLGGVDSFVIRSPPSPLHPSQKNQ